MTGIVVAVVGPTAVGKSALSLDLAQALGGEVVNADAMQLYRGMDIGTAKLTAAERRGVRHHLLDVLDVREEASVATYQRVSRAAVADIHSRGRVPILVGGSGLYLRAALDRLEIPPTDPRVRHRIEAEYAAHGLAPVLDRLTVLDPAAAAHINPANARRVIRALEVVELTGRPFSATMPQREYVVPTVVIGLTAARPVLDERIERRVGAMWEAGLLGEVRALAGQGLREGRTASRALGYAQALAVLDGGLAPAQAQADTVALTRRFARRQQSWFRPDPRIGWLAHDHPDLVAAAVELVRRHTGQ